MLKSLGQNEYGLYSIVGSMIAYLTLLDFGFGSAIVRYTAKIRAIGSKKEEWQLYGMFLLIYSIIGILVVLGGIVLYLNIGGMFESTLSSDELDKAKIMMIFMVINLAVSFPFGLYGSVISAYEKFIFQKVLTIISIFLSTGVMIAVLMLGYKAIGLIIVNTVFNFLTFFVNYAYCKFKLDIKFEFTGFDFVLFKDILLFSWWNFLGTITDRIYWNVGQFVLGFVSGTVAVAIYSVAIALMNMYMTMSCALNSVLLPKITKMAVTEGSELAISNLFIRTGRLQFSVIALIVSGFCIFGRPFIEIWAGTEYSQSYIITLMFFIVLVCPLIQNVGITIMQARGQMKFRSLVYLVISSFSLLGQLILGKMYGVIGCASAVVLALFLGQWIVMNFYYSNRQSIDIKLFWSEISKMAIVPVVLTILGYITISKFEIASWFNLFVGIILYVIIYLPLFWRFSFNSFEKEQFLPILEKLKVRPSLIRSKA